MLEKNITFARKMRVTMKSNNEKNTSAKETEDKVLSSPDQMGEYLKVTAVPTYLLATAIILLMVAFVVWGFLGNVTDKAHYAGVVFPAQGTTDITLPNKGMVRNMLVHNGDSVHQGQTVALVSIGESYSFLTSTVDGLVISTKTENETFEAFEPIVSVIVNNATGEESQHTQLIAFASTEAQRDLRIGMEAQVWPADEKRDEIGYVRGKITQVVRYPAVANEVSQTLRSDIMAQRLLGQSDVVYEVRIDLLCSPEDPTRYDWSFGEPADVSMGIGTYCSVLTETRRRSMFQYLFESVKSRFNSLKLMTE